MNTVSALRMTLAAGEAAPSLIQALFAAYWAEDRDLADPATLRMVADAAGHDGERLLLAAADPTVKEDLRARTLAAEHRGVFGVPTFVVGEELYFGQDRLDFVAAALAGSPP